jgi:hypothetical protein
VMMAPTELAIYKLLDGSRSISTLMEMTGLSDFDVCRTLFDFIDRNLVAPAGQEQAKASADAGRRGPAPAPGEGTGTLALVAVLGLSAVGLVVSATTPFRCPRARSLFQKGPDPGEPRHGPHARVAEALRTYCLTFGTSREPRRSQNAARRCSRTRTWLPRTARGFVTRPMGPRRCRGSTPGGVLEHRAEILPGEVTLAAPLR